MAKPWGRYEIDYVDHPKFQALNANAFLLWWQVKNYCDKFHTDGLIALNTVKGFRAYSQKTVALLSTSRGVKPSGAAYSPLLEPLQFGGVLYLRMHDYLDHNDCHDEVEQRLDDAEDKNELRRLANVERQRKFRQQRKEKIAQKKASLEADSHACVTLRNATVTRDTLTPTEASASASAEAEAEASRNLEERKERAIARGHQRSILAGSLPREHADHVFCDAEFSICVPARVHAKLMNLLARRFGGDREATHRHLQAWYAQVVASLPPEAVMGDAFKFWQGHFDAAFASPLPTTTAPSVDWAAIGRKGPSVRR